jgi:hypothetical protein
MELARDVLPEFGIASCCGLGHCPEELLVPTLDLLRDLTDPVTTRVVD